MCIRDRDLSRAQPSRAAATSTSRSLRGSPKSTLRSPATTQVSSSPPRDAMQVVEVRSSGPARQVDGSQAQHPAV
eukprot:13636252-Alexandrium_andersonii.AAC.1